MAHLPAVVSAAAKAGFRFWTVPAIVQECISDLINARPRLSFGAFQSAPEIRFATAFFGVVHLWEMSGPEALEAGMAVRRLRGEHAGMSARRAPSLADALLADALLADALLAGKIVSDPDVQLVVTDDPRDLLAVAPSFHRPIISVHDFIGTVAG